MRVEVITSVYNETFLAPLFLSHYAGWTDKITILTAQFPGGKLDDEIKMNLINDAIARSTASWVIAVDFDEFIWPLPFGTDPRKALEDETGHIIDCHMIRVWRHRTDSDIDRMKPPLPQRMHGTPDHHKPSIFRPQGVKLGIGIHSATFPPHYRWGSVWSAAHWANADPCFGIERSRTARQMRLSPNNLWHGWGTIPQWLEPQFLEREYEKHLDDPKMFG